MYVPLNRIITNLYTAPGEFVYKNSNAPYNGYYWKSYNGKIFTGKNPNDIPNEELIYTPISQDFIVGDIVVYSEIYNEPIFPAGLNEDGIIIPSDNVPSTLQEYIQIKIGLFQDKMNEAVEIEDYEVAAEMRDKIKELKNKI